MSSAMRGALMKNDYPFALADCDDKSFLADEAAAYVLLESACEVKVYFLKHMVLA
jgi:hypothetical protein